MKMRTNIPAQRDVDCPHCGTTHQGTRLQVDEDGAYYEIGETPCGHEGCTAMLCSACPKFVCAGCGRECCDEHEVDYYGEKWCKPCFLRAWFRWVFGAEVAA